MSINKKRNYEIRPETNIDPIKFNPQTTYPDDNLDFFLIHYHHFTKFEGINLLVASSIGGAVDYIPKIEPLLKEYTARIKYSWLDFFGYILQDIGPKIVMITQQVELKKGNEEEMKKELQEQIFLFANRPQNFMNLLNNLPLPFLQLSQESLPVFFSKSILESYKLLNLGLGNGPVLDSDEILRIDRLFYNLYKSKIMLPIFSTSICTNRNEPHFDFIFSNKPLREGNCRWCGQPLIVFNQYLIAEPYSSLKMQQKDISYLISSYLFVKSSRQLECYPEVYVKIDEKEEQVDVFIRNWSNRRTAIIECKIKEDPQSTFDTSRHFISETHTQIKRKMKALKVDYGYIVTNLIFNSNEEKDKIIKTIFKTTSKDKKIFLITRVKPYTLLEGLDKILFDLGLKE